MMLFQKDLYTVHSILNIYTLKESHSMSLNKKRLKILKSKIYYHNIYGFLKWRVKLKLKFKNGRKKRRKRQKGVGFALTADEHQHLKGKRLTNVSAPVDNHDATTKEFVTDLLKTKAGTTYVNNELAKKASQSSVNKALAALNESQKARSYGWRTSSTETRF